MQDRHCIRGTLRIELRGPAGEVVQRRNGSNTVVRSGAELVGALFSGAVATPINGMAVGTNAQPLAPPYEVTSLTTVDESGQPLQGTTAVALAADDTKIETLDGEMRVRISIRGVLPPEAALAHDGGTSFIGEAALGVLTTEGTKLSKIYNRVVFDPIPKGKQHELALYWEISFPYGV
jgi:hypothetical protein